MKRYVTLAGLICTALAALSAPAWGPTPATAATGDREEPSRDNLTFTLTAERPYAAPTGALTNRVVRLPAPEEPELEKAAVTLPTFTRSIVARGKTYKYTMVGSDPFVKNAKPVAVPLQIIPVRFEFDDGTLFDPTLPSPDCAGGGSALSRVLDSPIVKSVNYGFGDGSRQFEEEIRRFEFWSLTGAPGAINPSYSVRVSASVLPTLVIQLQGFPTGQGNCGRVGFLDLHTWDNFLKGTIFPVLRSRGVSAKTFPLFLFLNVVLFDGDPNQCCVLGYHSGFNFSGLQTYGIANYDVSQSFSGAGDISVLAHELGEWYDDPFGNNPTPSWGHTGQVPGCQRNLEVGDPLSGRVHTVTMPNHFTYHPQELAFFSWFYNQVPSLGLKGWYSSGGTFRSPAPLCR
jgi:hypothetical protein